MKRKGIEEYIAMAERFPQLTFHIVGNGGKDYNLKNEMTKYKSKAEMPVAVPMVFNRKVLSVKNLITVS